MMLPLNMYAAPAESNEGEMSVLRAAARQYHFHQTPSVLAAANEVVATVRCVLDAPDHQLDYAKAKIAFDQLIDPSVDEAQVLDELDRLVAAARELAGTATKDAARLNALRKLIYESGTWNDRRPFAYDHSDPQGRRLQGKLLHNYLATRLGQCVSMPVLFLILAERLGFNVALSTAPEHVFVRFTDASGRTINLETTSGAHPARDAWFRQNFPISDRAIESGLYLRSLTKREGVALMATTVMEHAFEGRRWEEAVALAEIILSHRPDDAQTMVYMGTAYGQLLNVLRRKYPPFVAPAPVQAQMRVYIEKNMSLFAAAERLGWVPFEQGGNERCS